MKNAAVADMFDTMADIMEIKGEEPFRVNSYRRVARVVRDLTEDIEQVHREGRLTDLEGVGKSSAAKIAQFLASGRIEAHEKLLKGFPVDVLAMLRIPTMGPKTVGRLMREKGIEGIEDLEKAIERGDLVGMSGMGEKTIQNIRAGIEFLRRSAGRTLLGEALPVAQETIERMREKCDLGAAEAAGSLRRMKETIGDIDILVTGRAAKRRKTVDEEVPGGKEIVGAFTSLPNVSEVLAAGGTKGSVRTQEGLQVDLRVVSPDSFGAALQYFTGSKAHNIKIRGIALDKGLKINEYGVFKGKTRVGGKTEEEVYKCLGLPWIPPELREDRGEVEAAAAGKLPELVSLSDIRGDLHVHTNYSDGAQSVTDMAAAAREMRYSYIAVTDHSPSLGIAGGVSAKDLRRQHAEIAAAQKKLRGFTIFKGTEVDILPDGRLDYPQKVLERLDIVLASVHSRFGMSEKEMTARIVKAVRNPHVTAIGHLTGRLIGQREPYAVNVGAVVEACAEHRTALELNAHMDRLDITDLVCRQAKEAGVKVLIGTDAHRSAHYWMMQLGVGTARRGWLEKGDVLNCMEADELLDYLKH
ncbi:MAG: DNA polymerase/3'-5' exonuclease PolX [Candidatus Brocadiae bacterium]|nr:DNA polymerase/3'-5' exonuclease PolX [Candidatus Brocadiia bacterium]